MNNNFNQMASSINDEKNSYLNRQQDKIDSEKERQDLLTEGITLPFLESSATNILQKGLKSTLKRVGFSSDDIEELKNIGKKIKSRDFSGALDDIQKNNKVKKLFKNDYLEKLENKAKSKISDVKSKISDIKSKGQSIIDDALQQHELVNKKFNNLSDQDKTFIKSELKNKGVSPTNFEQQNKILDTLNEKNENIKQSQRDDINKRFGNLDPEQKKEAMKRSGKLSNDDFLEQNKILDDIESRPKVIQPKATQPKVTQPKATQPKATQPSTQPEEIDPFSGKPIVKEKEIIKLPDDYDESQDDIVKLRTKLDGLDPESQEYLDGNKVYKSLVLSNKQDLAQVEAEARQKAFGLKNKGINSWENENYFKTYNKKKLKPTTIEQEQDIKPIRIKGKLSVGEQGYVQQEIKAREFKTQSLKPSIKPTNKLEEPEPQPELEPEPAPAPKPQFSQDELDDFDNQKNTIKSARKNIVKKINKLSDDQITHFNEKYNQTKLPKLDPEVNQQNYLDREVHNLNQANRAYIDAQKGPVDVNTNDQSQKQFTKASEADQAIIDKSKSSGGSGSQDFDDDFDENVTKIGEGEVEADPESIVGDVIFGGLALGGLLGGMFSHNDDKIKAPVLNNPTYQAGVDQA